MQNKNSYNSIFKASALFGGVQVFQVIIQLLRSKIVAIFLGPIGFGLFGLFNSTLNLIGNIVNCGISTSSVNEISVANTLSPHELSTKVYVLKKTMWLTGIIGMLLTSSFSILLSKFISGSDQYTFSFIWLSLSVLFNQLTSANLTILQGIRSLNSLAKANLYGSVFGLLFSFPFYFYWGISGIVYSIIIYSLTIFFFSWLFIRRLAIQESQLSKRETYKQGKLIFSKGYLLGISGLFSIATNYLISVYIARSGNIEQLGLYNAAIAISNNYTGLIFTAIATDYHPRLASLNEKFQIKIAVNQQAEIALIILSPLVVIFLVYGDSILYFLFSSKFVEVKNLICWILLGSYFKLFSWAISFVFLAKGKIKIFFWNEAIANIYVLALGLVGYYFYGLIGLGYSFLLSYLLYSLQVLILAKMHLGFIYNYDFMKKFLLQLIISSFCFWIMNRLELSIRSIIGTIILVFVIITSLLELKNKISFRQLLQLQNSDNELKN